MFFCEICEICWNTFFVEHHQTTAFDCSSIDSREGRISKQNRKLLKRAVQVKEQVSQAVVCRFFRFKNFVSFQRKHLWRSLLNKAARLKFCSSIKNILQYSHFPVKFANFLRTPFLQNSFSGYFWGLTRIFTTKIQKRHHRCSVKGGLQLYYYKEALVLQSF